MPTVNYSCPTSGKKMKKSFPYNAVGKAQAVEFAKMNRGSIKNNPGPYMETQTPRPKGEKRPISELGITPKSTRLGGSIPVGGGGVKGAIKMAAKIFGKLRKN
jgi:hypothetical protein